MRLLTVDWVMRSWVAARVMVPVVARVLSVSIWSNILYSFFECNIVV